MALSLGLPVLPIFIFDTNILDSLKHKADRRVTFIHQALSDIQASLEQFGASLYVLHNNPDDAFLKLIREFNIQNVFTNNDYEPYAIRRDEQIQKLLALNDISFHSFKDQVIFEKSEIVKSDRTPYAIFTPYSKSWKEKFNQHQPEFFPSENLKDQFYKCSFPLPTIEEICFEETPHDWPSCELNADAIRHYEETRNLPYIDGTSRLSVHLRFGTVSIRNLALKAQKLNEQWLNELIWREFFMMILFHFPRVVTESFKVKYEKIPWRNNEEEFKQWCAGATGYPMVDAGMRELNETGFMHNRVRMVVASFLTKHLLIDWRWGEAYFAEKLLDYELSSNNGNWQWAAGCGCDAAPYFRIFNPAEQARKFDPDFRYIRKWVKNFDDDYPAPIVEHEFARKRALEVFKRALADH
jgi:deoxyribodipyrimidine photo-lyase